VLSFLILQADEAFSGSPFSRYFERCARAIRRTSYDASG
jgi:hypothetical protein